jgi:hypothetical protein
MWLLPYENFYIESDLKPEDAIRRIQSTIYIPESDKSRILNYDVFSIKYFTGYVGKCSFKIQQNTLATKSPLPNIQGNILPYNDGSRINIKMTQIPSYVFFSLVITCLIIAGLVMNLTDKKFEKVNLVPFVMAVFAYFISMVSFKSSSREAKIS